MPNRVRTHPRLDEVDRRLVELLAEDGRAPNNLLAQQVGVAPSTCLARVRALREAGVVRGVHADVDLAAVGRPTQAVVLVTLRENARAHVAAFRRSIGDLPGVVASFYLAGSHDYLLHVAVRDSDALRDLLHDHVAAHPAVSSTQTHLVLDHARGRGPVVLPTSARRPAGGA